MKKASIILSLLILGLQMTVSAQQPDAVYKLVHHEWTLNTDGSSDYRYRHEVQILRNRALTAYADKGETFVVYNPEIEDVTVNEVYTLQLDGTRVDMPQNAFIHQLPSECADCGRFNHLRGLTMVRTCMEIGCVVVVYYTIHRRYNLLYENLPILRECPIEKLEIKVNPAKGMEVRTMLLGEQYLPKGVTKADLLKLDITLRNLPQAPKEAYMPEYINPVVRLFNATPEYTPAFDNEKFYGAKEAMGSVLTGNPTENLLARRDFILDNIHLNDIHPSHLGYRRATAAEVWASGCGTATDKAVLLAAILRSEGYKADVYGEHSDEVAILIDTLEYRLSLRNRTPLELIGKARDEMHNYIYTIAEEARFDTLEGGFYRLKQSGTPTSLPKASTLPLTRTTPMQATSCSIDEQASYTLPKNFKLMGDGIEKKLSFKGLGSLEISIKQSGKTLKITRNLRLEKSLIPADEYSNYRLLLATWQKADNLIFRTK